MLECPVDPTCPEVAEFYRSLEQDPMIRYSGVGEELVEDFEKRHIVFCQQCQEYGAAHIEVQ